MHPSATTPSPTAENVSPARTLSASESVPELQAAQFVERGPKRRRVTVVHTHLSQGAIAWEQLRAIQTCLLLREVQHWDQCKPSPLVFCGDLNTIPTEPDQPREACLELLERGEVSPEHHCFVYGRTLGLPTTPPAEGAATCSVAITDAGDVFCPNLCLPVGEAPRVPSGAGIEIPRLCWDHMCRGCEKGKGVNYRYALCPACSEAGVVPAPLPPAVAAQMFQCRLSLVDERGAGGGKALPRLVNAYEVITGAQHIYEVDFHPCRGTPRKNIWRENKDHIYVSAGLTPLRVAPAPAIASLGTLPSLTWPSDHMAYVVDVRFD